jgi:hypothetical protein
MQNNSFSPRQKALLWLGIFALVGIALVLLYPDGFQQDSGYHFLFARWAWRYHYMFVGVWQRPLFTFIYSFPALLGYQTARLFTVAICLATAWQTWKLAQDLKLERTWLVIPVIFLQPSFFVLFPDLLTETLFALVFVIALRLHTRGRVKLGMVVASLLIMARPEGFFLGVLWGVWILFDKRVSTVFWRRVPWSLLLAVGSFIWWLAAYIITKDPLFIKNNWPSDWHEGVYGYAQLWSYPARLPEMVGPLLLIPFLVGLVLLLKRREHIPVTTSFLLPFLLHTVFWKFGMVGEAGYPRYMVSVAPAMALITLVGWNKLAEKLRNYSQKVRLATGTAVLFISAALCVLYLDGMPWPRDGWAIKEMHQWFRQNERPVTQLVWSHAMMCAVFNIDMMTRPFLSNNREANQKLLSEAPTGTLIFWDSEIGPKWYSLTDQDFESIGYKRLRSRSYSLTGYLWMDWTGKMMGPRNLDLHLFYKE